MKKKLFLHTPLSFYFVCMLCSLSCVALICLVSQMKRIIYESEPEIKTEIKYVYVTVPSEDDKPVDTTPQAIYTVKEHSGIIGIFDQEGALVRVIEVYTKTLPEADRRLLGEGFEIVGDDQLNSIIEDYSS